MTTPTVPQTEAGRAWVNHPEWFLDDDKPDAIQRILAIEAEAIEEAAPALPDGLDVERLTRALRAAPSSSIAILGHSRDAAIAIAAEYAAIQHTEEEE